MLWYQVISRLGKDLVPRKKSLGTVLGTMGIVAITVLLYIYIYIVPKNNNNIIYIERVVGAMRFYLYIIFGDFLGNHGNRF